MSVYNVIHSLRKSCFAHLQQGLASLGLLSLHRRLNHALSLHCPCRNMIKGHCLLDMYSHAAGLTLGSHLPNLSTILIQKPYVQAYLCLETEFIYMSGGLSHSQGFPFKIGSDLSTLLTSVSTGVLLKPLTQFRKAVVLNLGIISDT